MENKEDIHITKGFASPLPYPEVKVANKNPYYAELLIDDYSGFVSEFTAINQYLYHNFFNSSYNKEVANILEKTAIVEMKHMEILAELILKLGVEPLFRLPKNDSNAFRYWNGSFVFYGKDMCEQLKADLDSEFKAIESYNKHIKIIQDPYIDAILKRIILDEEVHAKIFKEAIDKYCKK